MYKINNMELTEEQVKEVVEEYVKNNKMGLVYISKMEANRQGHKRKYFEPRDCDTVYQLEANGIYDRRFIAEYEDEDHKETVKRGVFLNKEEAQHADKRRMALVRIWNWADTNAPFTPDWIKNSTKFRPRFDYCLDKWTYDYEYMYQDQFELPYFATQEDCDRFIKECKDDLEIIRK